jgi:hypothetical protein
VYAQVTPPPAASGLDPRAQSLAEALANMRDPANTIRTPVALASDLLAEALLRRKYGQSPQEIGPSAPTYAPQGRPGPLQVAPVPQATPIPSPSPGVPPPSAPAGTASAAPAASSPAAGAATAPPSTSANGAQGLSPTLVDALNAWFAACAPTLWRPDLVKALTPAAQTQDPERA